MEKFHTETSVYWRVILNVDKKKTDYQVKKILTLLNVHKVIVSEPYWKIPGRYDLQLEQIILFNNTENLIFQVLKTSSLISKCWKIDFSPNFGYKDCTMSGITDSDFKVKGVEWINFEI